MIKSLTILLLVIINFLLIPKKVFSSLKINEVYPAPSPGEEWVELYSDKEILIDSFEYLLIDEKENKIKLINPDKPSNFFIATSSSILNNNGDTVYLYKCPEAELIDWVSYSNINSNFSYGRYPDGADNWFKCSPTKNASNSGCLITPTSTVNPTITPPFSLCPTFTPTPTPLRTPSLTPTPSPIFVLTQTPVPTPISYEKIYLSEVMVDPANGEKEWVEIYNDNDFLVKLDNWFIDDFENSGSTPKSFNMVLDKKNYGVIELSSAIFNNSGDQVRLLDFNKSEKDGFEYSSSKSGNTYGRVSFSSEEWCLQEPTKGKENNFCLVISTTTSDSLTPSFNPQLTKSSPSSSNKSANFFSSFKQKNSFPNKKIFKSYQLKSEHTETKKNSFSGEVLAGETKRNNKKNDLLFLLLFYSLSSNFFFLRKILKQIPWKS